MSIRKVATLQTDHLDIIQADLETLWWKKRDGLRFTTQSVHVFVLDPEGDSSPAALILTTKDDPGNPAQHRESVEFRCLTDSDETMILAFVPKEHESVALAEMVAILDETLMGRAYGLDEDS
jgi:hypothetical protein